MVAIVVQESQILFEKGNTLDNSVVESPVKAEIVPGLEEEWAKEQLVTRALQGDQQAFGDIVEQYSTLMLRTASMIVGDHDIAEDVVRDALIQAWHHLGDLRKAGALRPWLMRIVVNQCISFKRRLART
ncbi:MAG: hypothetical protein JO215_09120, partial [Ktedonobacteraceae bacterium]|nr:hypothetical protein [Ktedonobacteraceae bacterium]